LPTKARKVRKYRGSRTHGYGQIGQHRSRGGRGGTGKAGLDKHKWTYVVKHDPTYWLKHGFVSTRTLNSKVKIINVGKLDELVDRLDAVEKLERQENKVVLDLESLGFDKLLGTGAVTKPMIVKVAAYSESASQKLEEAGGAIFTEEE
jgi:large subunit ribosomal protein L15